MFSRVRACALFMSAILVLGTNGTGQAAAPPSEDAATLALRAVGQGAVHLRNGDLFLACHWFRQGVDLAPTWPMARYELGRCLRMVGDPHAEADKHLKAAINAQPHRFAFRLAQARLVEDQGSVSMARTAYTKAARLSPDDVRGQDGLARLVRPTDGQVALERLRRFIRKHPLNLAGRALLAEVAEALGANDEAEAALRWLLERSRAPCSAATRLAAFGARTNRQKATREGRIACPR